MNGQPPARQQGSRVAKLRVFRTLVLIDRPAHTTASVWHQGGTQSCRRPCMAPVHPPAAPALRGAPALASPAPPCPARSSTRHHAEGSRRSRGARQTTSFEPHVCPTCSTACTRARHAACSPALGPPVRHLAAALPPHLPLCSFQAAAVPCCCAAPRHAAGLPGRAASFPHPCFPALPALISRLQASPSCCCSHPPARTHAPSLLASAESLRSATDCDMRPYPLNVLVLPEHARLCLRSPCFERELAPCLPPSEHVHVTVLCSQLCQALQAQADAGVGHFPCRAGRESKMVQL